MMFRRRRLPIRGGLCRCRLHARSVIISFAKLEYDNHIEITHTEVCTKCEYKCVNKDVLNEHMESHYSEMNSFKCSECVYKCTSQDLLHIHKRSAVVDNQRRRSRAGSDIIKKGVYLKIKCLG